VIAHLDRHALGAPLVELARPVVREAIAGVPDGPRWVRVRWEDQFAALEVRELPDRPLPGRPVTAGVTRAHDAAAELIDELGSGPGVRIDLGVARPPERVIDAAPAVPGTLGDDRPFALLGFLGNELASGADLQLAAAGMGATLAQLHADELSERSDAGDVATAFMAVQEELGGDFHLVEVSDRRAVLGNRRCPFGDKVPAGLCRFTSALAGTLAARCGPGAEVTLDERIALGDPQCRIVVDIGPPSGRVTAHRYEWPPPVRTIEAAPLPEAEPVGFRVRLSLQLPRDRMSVPMTRHLVEAAMREVGVIDDDTAAVKLAITEACANVVSHSGPGDAYEVAVSLEPAHCHIRVLDIGRGFDHESLAPPRMAHVDAEHGRGLALMHALVDQVRFESQPERGTVVHLVKRLHFDESAPARRFLHNPELGAEG
jgi:serine/threonine-protein kinase RsbW